MPQVKIYNMKGESVGDMQVSEAVFGAPSNDTLLHQVFVALAANLRGVYAHAKDRSERAGSGRKLWKQKGTGRARVGSVRSPLWRKGGIVFGPTKDRNFSQKVNQKMRKKAAAIALSEKLRAEKLLVIDGFDFSEKKTKLFAAGLEALHVADKTVLVSLTASEKATELMLRNIKKTVSTPTDTLNVHDLLNSEYIILSRESIAQLESRLATKQA